MLSLMHRECYKKGKSMSVIKLSYKMFYYSSLAITIFYTYHFFSLAFNRYSVFPQCLILALFKCVASGIITLIVLRASYQQEEKHLNKRFAKYDNRAIKRDYID